MKAQLCSDIGQLTSSIGYGKDMCRTEDMTVMKPGEWKNRRILKRVDTKVAWKCLQEGT